MSDTYRHHRAHAGGPADTRIIFVPIEIGSPKVARTAKPGQYPRNPPTHWQPRTKPPSKAEALRRFLDGVAKNGEAVREFMRQAREEASHATN